MTRGSEYSGLGAWCCRVDTITVTAALWLVSGQLAEVLDIIFLNGGHHLGMVFQRGLLLCQWS